MAKKRQRSQQSSKDRISALPIHIVHHILSFLPLDDAMMMTFLSRVWRDVWIGIPILNLDKTLFYPTLAKNKYGPLSSDMR